MKMPFTKKVYTEEETKDLALNYSSLLKEGDIVVLNGNLGAGKTFFIKSILNKYNVENANSPTFAIVNEYSGDKRFYHFDFYRIEQESELYDIGFDEYMNAPDAIKFIEWGGLFSEILPRKRKEINILLNDDLTREFSFVEYE